MLVKAEPRAHFYFYMQWGCACTTCVTGLFQSRDLVRRDILNPSSLPTKDQALGAFPQGPADLYGGLLLKSRPQTPDVKMSEQFTAGCGGAPFSGGLKDSVSVGSMFTTWTKTSRYSCSAGPNPLHGREKKIWPGVSKLLCPARRGLLPSVKVI